jgi:hypothetical protein
MRIGTVLCTVIAAGWVLLAIIQLWLLPLSPTTFFKISVTAGLLFAIVLVISLVAHDFFREKKLKDDGFID